MKTLPTFPTLTNYEQMKTACEFYAADLDNRAVALHEVCHAIWDIMKCPKEERFFANVYDTNQPAVTMGDKFKHMSEDKATCTMVFRSPAFPRNIHFQAVITLSDRLTAFYLQVGDWSHNHMSREDAGLRNEALRGAAEHIMLCVLEESQPLWMKRR